MVRVNDFLFGSLFIVPIWLYIYDNWVLSYLIIVVTFVCFFYVQFLILYRCLSNFCSSSYVKCTIKPQTHDEKRTAYLNVFPYLWGKSRLNNFFIIGFTLCYIHTCKHTFTRKNHNKYSQSQDIIWSLCV